MEGPDTFAAFAATYVSLEDADCESHTSRPYDEHMVHTIDTAVCASTTRGRSRASRSGTSRCGKAPGLVVGRRWRPARVALFPAVAIGAGLAWGAGIGAGLWELVGRAAGGMSRPDVKDLGETLDITASPENVEQTNRSRRQDADDRGIGVPSRAVGATVLIARAPGAAAQLGRPSRTLTECGRGSPLPWPPERGWDRWARSPRSTRRVASRR